MKAGAHRHETDEMLEIILRFFVLSVQVDGAKRRFHCDQEPTQDQFATSLKLLTKPFQLIFQFSDFPPQRCDLFLQAIQSFPFVKGKVGSHSWRIFMLQYNNIARHQVHPPRLFRSRLPRQYFHQRRASLH